MWLSINVGHLLNRVITAIDREPRWWQHSIHLPHLIGFSLLPIVALHSHGGIGEGLVDLRLGSVASLCRLSVYHFVLSWATCLTVNVDGV